MRAALIIAVLVVIALASVLIARTYRRLPEKVEASEYCAARDVKPPPLLRELTAVPLIVNHPGVSLRIDGNEKVPETLLPGVHQLEASAPGARPSKIPVTVRGVSAVMFDARIVENSVTVLVLGARCKTCDVARTDIDVRFQPRALGSISDAAAALSSGEWAKAAEALRSVPDEERAADFHWLHAVLLAFAGQPSKAREVGPPSDSIREFDARTRDLPERLLATATQRWNATADRFERVTSEFSVDAPEICTQLTQRFSKLSEKFSAALTAKDPIETETALEAATSELENGIETLRATRADCAWQQRIVSTF